MKRPPPLFLLFAVLLLAGCSSNSSSTTTRYWATHTVDGDKPGTGFILTERGGEIVAGRFYILDPDKPGDFAGGFGSDLTDFKITNSGATFTITIPSLPAQTGEMIYDRTQLPTGRLPTSFRSTSIPDSVFIPFIFTPTPNPPPPGLSISELEAKDREAAAK